MLGDKGFEPMNTVIISFNSLPFISLTINEWNQIKRKVCFSFSLVEWVGWLKEWRVARSIWAASPISRGSWLWFLPPTLPLINSTHQPYFSLTSLISLTMNEWRQEENKKEERDEFNWWGCLSSFLRYSKLIHSKQKTRNATIKELIVKWSWLAQMGSAP